jgi:hypothetical protein
MAQTDPAVQLQMDQANRFLQAETTKEIRAMGDRVEKNLKEYQDQNFRILDGRVQAAVQSYSQKVVISVAGVSLLVSGLVSWFLFTLARKYAYADYVKAQIDQQAQKAQDAGYLAQTPQMQQMSQPEWHPEEKMQTIGMAQGQSFASNTSVLSNWQVQSPYHGGYEWSPDQQQGGQR